MNKKQMNDEMFCDQTADEIATRIEMKKLDNVQGENNKEEKSEDNNQKLRKKSKLKKIFITLAVMFVIGLGGVGFLLYGPYSGFREWLVTTAMTTLSHQYLATWFYDDETIKSILDKNKVIEQKEDTDSSLVKIGKINFNAEGYKNQYEKEILTRDSDNDDYKLINITGKKYKGYLVAVYHPEKLKVMTSKYVGKTGQYLVKMAQEQKATVAINGGGFYDPNYSSNGGIPQGTVIKDGKIVSEREYHRSGGLIGFTKDNKLTLLKDTDGKSALKKGIRDAVTFGPFLIVNGKSSFVKGNGGWGTAPRTAIGQRADGIVLLLVIDGRTIKYPGADMGDLVEIMERYGAINAANLDGGTSSALVIKNQLVNDPVSGSGAHETRPIATGIGLFL